MGTGDVETELQMIGFHFSLTFLFFFLFFFAIHQHSENHEQCGHAEAYSTVMLWG